MAWDIIRASVMADRRLTALVTAWAAPCSFSPSIQKADDGQCHNSCATTSTLSTSNEMHQTQVLLGTVRCNASLSVYEVGPLSSPFFRVTVWRRWVVGTWGPITQRRSATLQNKDLNPILCRYIQTAASKFSGLPPRMLRCFK
jgi:hypothetical protein